MKAALHCAERFEDAKICAELTAGGECASEAWDDDHNDHDTNVTLHRKILRYQLAIECPLPVLQASRTPSP